MPNPLHEPELEERDGTSQAERRPAALDPGYAAVDERSTEDALAFVQQYARELKYFGEDNEEDGDWSGFLPEELDLAQVAAFMEHPEKFTAEEHPLLFRPHFVLFLTFLKLLGHTRAELDALPRRHLDFYYRQVLHLRPKAAVPDRVNLLIDLADGVDQLRLDAGTLASAGPDSLGQERFYATDRDVVVSRAQVAQLSSVHVEYQVTELADVRTLHKNDLATLTLAMLELALSTPDSGDPLPLYPRNPPPDVAVDFDFLNQLRRRLDFAAETLFMRFSQLRELMKLKRQRDGEVEEWEEINLLLERAGQARDPDFSFETADPTDFDGNLELALGALDFDGLPEVTDVYDLYDQRHREDVQTFIAAVLFFENRDDFHRMMQLKILIDSQWREINHILEKAGERRDAAFTFDDFEFAPNDFAARLAAALPGAGDIEGYTREILDLEDYFFMPAEDFADFIDLVNRAGSGEELGAWQQADRILEKAHREQFYTRRREALERIRQADGLVAMIAYALGEEETAETDLSSVLARLIPFLGRPQDDLAKLEEAAAGLPEEQDWQPIYRIVEVAQRNRQGLAEPVPRKEAWRNLHPAVDATALQVSSGVQGEQDLSRWRTFGPYAARRQPGPSADAGDRLGRQFADSGDERGPAKRDAHVELLARHL